VKNYKELVDTSRRTERIDARLTKEEHDTFMTEAKLLKMSKSTFVKFLLVFYLKHKNRK
jgi:uncharacterized protein (DUF1778 family)